MSTRIEYKRPPMVSYQTAILDAPVRYTVTEASTKTGKTASHIVWLLEQALKCKDNQSVWWVAPVYGQAEIAFNRMRKQINNKAFFKVNETKLTLTLPHGAKISFKSAEKPDNLYGDDVYAAVFDEFTRAKVEAWYALRSTLTATRGPCKFIGNVKGKKNWGHSLALKARSGEKDFQYFKITAYDAVEAGILDLEEIEAAKNELPEHVFNELYLAEASDDGSNPFGQNFIDTYTKPISSRPSVCFGVDLAKSVDWTVIIGMDHAGDISHFERFRKDWKQTTERVKEVIGDKPAVIDSTGVGDPIVEEVQRTCRKVQGFKYTQQSKQQIMEGLASAIQKGKTSVLEGIHKDEMESFEFEYTKTGVRYTAPVGLHDDTVNAHALCNSIHNASIKVINIVII
jgi:phage FluMu gp28-like protein